ncbi:beta-glucosidase [Brevundimonas sp. Leaf363]|uniref:GH1 family beta-glucosidase n=1 Tax=Brevundimonas sp. Leaf363 TaxID=1736353 RepID=UPI0006F24CC1|nr:GH1 family beta-glucosidase [Brevundimonas sp. Leaf363]KQS53920.1 beta-glucosidase [Brevundimonas sp. Leaf363]
MDRRNFMQALALGGGAAAAGGAASSAFAAPMDLSFPADFQWGCATAAYQIEGGVNEDGRGQTNWDVFSHTPGKVAGGDTGDVACDSYHRYATDIGLLKNMGVKTYRMSLAWARIFPDGRGQPNQKGLDYYNRVVDGLLEAGITPYITMFHWDLPTALPGGWQNRDTARAFADYAGFTAGKLGDRVKHFITTNEIRCFTDLGHQVGIHAPGLKLDPAGVNQVRHHGTLAHGLGVQAIRAATGPGTIVGVAENPNIFAPTIETPENIEAAKKAYRHDNAPFLTAIMEGKYVDTYLEDAGAAAPKVEPGDMEAIASPLDFVALNIYTCGYVEADDSARGYKVLPRPTSAPRMASPWLYMTPEAGYWGVRLTSDLWSPKEIYISENGCSADDAAVDGYVADTDRVTYLRNYLSEFHRATVEGYPLKGYFLWSLMDNFEWADGYGKRFGVHYVDFATQQRTPKLSALWYKRLIERNHLV